MSFKNILHLSFNPYSDLITVGVTVFYVKMKELLPTSVSGEKKQEEYVVSKIESSNMQLLEPSSVEKNYYIDNPEEYFK